MSPLEFLTGFTTNLQNLESLLSKLSLPFLVHRSKTLGAAMPRGVILSPLLPITPSPYPLS
jgi:hypothetical protein